MLSTDGPGRNVLKFKPPMCFSRDNVEHVVAKLDAILTGKLKAPCPADHVPRTQPSSYNGLVYSGEGDATAELGILCTVQETRSSRVLLAQVTSISACTGGTSQALGRWELSHPQGLCMQSSGQGWPPK